MSRTTAIKCPHCDAPIEYDGSERYVICEFCGSKVEIASENEIVFRKVDEAEVQKTKTERVIKLKKLDAQMAENERDSEHQNRYRIIWAAIVVVCLFAGLLGNEDMFYLAFLAAVVGFFGKSIKRFFQKLSEPSGKPGFLQKWADDIEAEEKRKKDAGYICIPPDLSLKVFPTIKVAAAVEMLKNAGFTNVSAVNLRDLKNNEKHKKDLILKVTIDGKDAFKNELYPPDGNVQVLYHDFPEEYYNNPMRLALNAVSSKLRSKQ